MTVLLRVLRGGGQPTAVATGDGGGGSPARVAVGGALGKPLGDVRVILHQLLRWWQGYKRHNRFVLESHAFGIKYSTK